MIYLASPYTSKKELTQEFRAFAAKKCAAEMIAKGEKVFSPIAYGAMVEASIQKSGMQIPTYDFWMEFCFEMLRLCDHLYVLMIPGWKESAGVKAEMIEAKKLNIPISYISTPFNEPINSW